MCFVEESGKREVDYDEDLEGVIKSCRDVVECGMKVVECDRNVAEVWKNVAWML